MKKLFLIFAISLVFFSCNLFVKNSPDSEPPYKAKIAWDSGLVSNSHRSTIIDGDSVYFYERPPEYNSVNVYTLTRLDAVTGALIWRSPTFTNIIFCPPVALGSYIYVFIDPNVICCFNKENGELSAITQANIENADSVMSWNVTGYGQYLYFGLRGISRCFVRLDVNDIDHGDPETIQTIVPEILWQPETGKSVTAKPVVYDNTVYTGTYDPLLTGLIELAGFNIDTKEMVFYKAFGGIEDVLAGNISNPDKGAYIDANPILIHDDVLYYLGWSIAAWNLKTGKRLYRHVFTDDVPNAKRYYANGGIMQAVFYKGKIYYTNISSYTELGYRNIHCIDAATGTLVWNDIAKDSASLITIPLIAHGRLYVCQSVGLRVYEPETGRLIGVDKSFEGADMDRNVLYGDYMICLRYNKGYTLVAVDVGK